MSWFEVNVEILKSKTWMVDTAAPGYSLDDVVLRSFSTISWVWYGLLLAGLLSLGYVLFTQAGRLGDKLASYLRVAVVFSFLLIVYGSYLILLLWKIPFSEIPDAIREGVFGDSLGTLNTLFSGLAFSGVLLTLLFQRKDLSETRSQIASQQSESQFYNLLGHQQEVVKNFDLQNKTTDEVVSRGRDCFRTWSETLQEIHEHYSVALGKDEGHIVPYELVYEMGRADLSLYFRSLYSVFRFIEKSNYEGDAQFGVVLRSLLSDYELVMLFYNSLSIRGVKFRRFIYEHALFDNLDPDLLLDPNHALHLDIEAFGQNEAILRLFPDPLGPPGRGGG